MNERNNFPLVRRPSSAIEKAAPGAKRILSGMIADTLALVKKPSLRIVILDDEPNYLELYELIINNFCKEATLLKFRNSWEALRELLRVAPDLLITDMCHGALEGREMLPLLARKKVKFPILVISGSISEEGVRQCSGPELNVFYMLKPFQFEEFRTVFETVLKIPRNTASRGEAMCRKTAVDPTELESWFQKGKSCFESKNYTEAMSWYGMAAAHNHAQAQYELGCCYEDGSGVLEDNIEAALWYRNAAVQRHAGAQYDDDAGHLWHQGNCYAAGNGVVKDAKEAEKWFKMAREKWKKDAEEMLAAAFANQPTNFQ